MKHHDAVVIGAGAAGLTAAISAKRRGASVLVCERLSGPGKKILATGGGRCNLSNERLDPSVYNSAARGLVSSVFGRFGVGAIRGFFEELGLAIYSDDGRLYPATNQAASVLRVLELELARLSVPVEFSCGIERIEKTGEGFSLKSKTQTHRASRVILCGGGKSYPALGSDGNAYALALSFGHRLVEPVPSAVPLVSRDPWCHLLQGQRVRASVTALAGGKIIGQAQGELLFTKYGLSGTAILDVSEAISIALHRGRAGGIEIAADLVPFLEKDALEAEFDRRLARNPERGELLTGLLPQKFSYPLKNFLLEKDIPALAAALKNRRFQISGTRGWNEAEFTAGGIDTGEVGAGLESKKQKGLYLAGEILDVQGPRGGYNLAWAWASGFVAGLGEGNY